MGDKLVRTSLIQNGWIWNIDNGGKFGLMSELIRPTIFQHSNYKPYLIFNIQSQYEKQIIILSKSEDILDQLI
jgi:hypothetical protein